MSAKLPKYGKVLIDKHHYLFYSTITLRVLCQVTKVPFPSDAMEIWAVDADDAGGRIGRYILGSVPAMAVAEAYSARAVANEVDPKRYVTKGLTA